MVLMVIAALNFARHFVALRRSSLETYKKDPECRAIFADPRPERARHRGCC